MLLTLLKGLSVQILFWSGLFSPPQETDYKSVFGKDWDKAQSFITENESWMKKVSGDYGVNFPEVVAIVFPELIRYSALRDKMEITMLKTLYINLGAEYADFSIGQFQMKPSFAEDINEKVWFLPDRKIKRLFRRSSSSDNPRLFRSSIVSELEDLRNQFSYLIAFIKICEREYPVELMKDEEKIQFLATAYNCGLNKSEDYIWSMSGKKFFSARLVPAETYSYSDISLFWYRDKKQTPDFSVR